MSQVSLINRIENAFDGTARAETSLRQFQLIDKYGMSRHITVDEWAMAGKRRVDLTWQDIPDEEIEECDCLLAHMGAEDFLYYLPAYIRYGLKNRHRPMWETNVLGMTLSSLLTSTKNEDLRAYAITQYSALNETQVQLVVHFLEFTASLEDDVRHSHALEALTSYWQKKV